MKKAWYQRPGTWLCVFILTLALLTALAMDERQPRMPEDQNLQIQVVDNHDAYMLEFAQIGVSGTVSSGGVMNADGSPLTEGESYGWEAGTGPAPVTVTALDQEGKTLFEIAVSCCVADPCVLLLTAEGFVPAYQGE